MSRQTRLFGKEKETKKKIEARKNIPLEEAKRFADKVLMEMCWDVKFEAMSTVGSVRRKRPTVNDVDFVVIASDKEWTGLRAHFLEELEAVKVCAGDKVQRYILDGVELDFYRATEDTYGIHKLIRTGSAEHNIFLAKLAISKGMRIKYNVGIVKGYKVLAGASESTIFTVLGLPFIEPELREVDKSGKPLWKGKIQEMV